VLCFKNIHIYQLNSYKPQAQRKWARDNIGDILLRSVWALGAGYLVRELYIPGLALCNVLFIAVFLLNLPKKAKKPLVFTARVKRLLATYGLIHVLLIIIGFTALDYIAYFCLVFSLCLVGAPWLVLFADYVNRPMEKAIIRHYINEAKKNLADMPDLKVIGVTGSYGKTSVKFYIEKLLSVKYNVLATPESYNTISRSSHDIRERLRPIMRSLYVKWARGMSATSRKSASLVFRKSASSQL
jgi:UDP-N-acetylmuramoyl-tripeptide--D-alanyl-D-alanine ligase